MSGLYHIIYASRATKEFTKEELLQLLDVAKENNKLVDVTGMLLYCEGSFLQLIEGELAQLKKLYNRIEKDPRHDNTTRIVEEPIEERRFDNWSMGFKGISKDEFLSIEGLNDFYRFNRCLTALDEGRAKTVLQAFSDGRWRA